MCSTSTQPAFDSQLFSAVNSVLLTWPMHTAGNVWSSELLWVPCTGKLTYLAFASSEVLLTVLLEYVCYCLSGMSFLDDTICVKERIPVHHTTPDILSVMCK